MKIPRISQKKLLLAITDSGGVVLTVAKRLNISWQGAKKAIDRDLIAKQAWFDEREKLLDLCENSIINAVAGGDVGEARWVLSRLGKLRGYGDYVELNASVTDKRVFNYEASIDTIAPRPANNSEG